MKSKFAKGKISSHLSNLTSYRYWNLYSSQLSKLSEPRGEKTGFLHMRKQRRRSASLRGNREADQRLCFRYSDITIPLLPKSEISSL